MNNAVRLEGFGKSVEKDLVKLWVYIDIDEKKRYSMLSNSNLKAYEFRRNRHHSHLEVQTEIKCMQMK